MNNEELEENVYVMRSRHTKYKSQKMYMQHLVWYLRIILLHVTFAVLFILTKMYLYIIGMINHIVSNFQ